MSDQNFFDSTVGTHGSLNSSRNQIKQSNKSIYTSSSGSSYNKIDTNDVSRSINDDLDFQAKELLQELTEKHCQNIKTTPRLPEKLETFKAAWTVFENRIRLPLVHQISPRTKKKISQLPTPSEIQKKKVNDIEANIKTISGSSIYNSLTQVSNNNRLKSRRYELHKIDNSPNSQVFTQEDKILWNNRHDDYDKISNIKSQSTAFFDKLANKKKRSLRRHDVLASSCNSDSFSFENPLMATNTNIGSNTTMLPKLLSASQPLQIKSELTEYLNKKRATDSLYINTSELSTHPTSAPTTWTYDTSPGEKNSFSPTGKASTHLSVPSADAAHISSIQAKSKSKSQYSMKSKDNTAGVDGNDAKITRPISFSMPKTVAITPSPAIPSPPPNHFLSSAATLPLMNIPPTQITSTATTGNYHAVTADELYESYRPVLEETAKTQETIISKYNEAQIKLSQSLKASQVKLHASHDFLSKWKAALFDENGIDIDKTFNAERKRVTAISTFYYHFYFQRIKSAILNWKHFAVSETRRRRLVAIALLLRWVRGCLARIHVRERRRNILLQLEAEARLREEEAEAIKRAAVSVCCAWRCVLACRQLKILVRHKRSAIVIQRVFRGTRGRKMAHERKVRKQSLNNAARMIQCVWRIVLAKRQVEVFRKIEAVRKWKICQNIRSKLLRSVFYRNGAAVCVAGAYRTFVIKDRLKSLIHWSKVMGAIELQRVYRGFRARKIPKKLRAEILVRENLRVAAVIKIQSFIRMVLAHWKLLELRKEREEAKKMHRLAKEERMKDKAVQLFVGSRINISRWRRWFRSASKLITPFRNFTEARSAERIQRCYRGYRGRRLCDRRKIRLALQDIYESRRRELRAALLLQRIWRGHFVRRNIRNQKRHDNAVKIQLWYRSRIARRFVANLRIRIIASNIIKKSLRSAAVYKRYLKSNREYLVNASLIRVMQRCMRRCLAKRRRREAKESRRVRAEAGGSAALATTKALSSIQLMLLAESLERPIGKKISAVSGEECTHSGVLQALFVFALNKRAQAMDISSLSSSRIDGSSFIRLMAKVEGLMTDSKSGGGGGGGLTIPLAIPTGRSTQSREPMDVNDTASSNASSAVASSGGSGWGYDAKFPKKKGKVYLALFEAIRLKLVALPKIVKKVNKTDLDLAFNKCKTTPGVNALTYSEFVILLKTIGDLVFDSVAMAMAMAGTSASASARNSIMFVGSTSDDDTIATGTSYSNRRGSFIGSVSSVERASDDEDSFSIFSDLSSGTSLRLTTDSLSTAHNSTKAIPSQKSSVNTFTGGGSSRKFRSLKNKKQLQKAASTDKLNGSLTGSSKSGFREKMFFPVESLLGDAGTTGLSLAVLMLLSVEKDEGSRDVLEWLETESRARLGFYAIRIQKLVRRKIAQSWLTIIRANSKYQKELSQRTRAIVLCQKTVRGYLCRVMIIKKAQKVIKKFVPSSGPPYWYNPSMDSTTWVKPKALKEFECLSIPVPEEGLEYVVRCCSCNRPATVNCLNCEDSMCQICFPSLHCKGKRKTHVSRKIPVCSVCTYQMATKACTTCALRRPKKGSIQEVMKKDFSTLCDTCFCHHHDINSSRSETEWARRDAAKTLESSKDAYIVRQSLQQRILTDHNYENLVQPCEECQWRGAVWRCHDCDQVYCDKCITALHSMGGPFVKHDAESLPYYSPELHRRYESGSLARRLQDGIQRAAQAYARFQLETKMRAVVRLQTWWRRIQGSREGKAYMKRRRLEERRRYKLRKIEDAEIRSKLGYKIRDMLGRAPALRSDTEEEKILKKLTYFGRRRASEYIWQNKEDWGYYRISRTIPRKGIPKRGFAVGLEEELLSQARRGGFRVPGRVRMLRGKCEHETTRDLSLILSEGQYIRIDKYIFGVVKVTDKTLQLDRRWRGLDDVQELVYRLPSLLDEKKRRYYRLRHLWFHAVTRNPISQNILKLHHYVTMKVSGGGHAVSRSFKNRGFMETAYRWTNFSKKWSKYAEWSSLLLEDELSTVKLVDLSTVATEDVRKALRRSLEKRIKGNDFFSMNDELRRLRKEKENMMTIPELLKEAEKWEPRIDPVSNKVFYVHLETKEEAHDTPASVEQKNYKAAENERKKIAFEETQKKIMMLSKKKLGNKGKNASVFFA